LNATRCCGTRYRLAMRLAAVVGALSMAADLSRGASSLAGGARLIARSTPGRRDSTGPVMVEFCTEMMRHRQAAACAAAISAPMDACTAGLACMRPT